MSPTYTWMEALSPQARWLETGCAILFRRSRPRSSIWPSNVSFTKMYGETEKTAVTMTTNAANDSISRTARLFHELFHPAMIRSPPVTFRGFPRSPN